MNDRGPSSLSTPETPLAEALRRSEERLRSIVTAMGEGVVLQSVDGAIQDCNAAAERILGLTRAQMGGRTSLDPGWRAIHEDGRPFPGEEHPGMITLRTGQPFSNVIMGVHKPDGSLTWISVSSEPLRHAPGEAPYAVVATFADVTTLKRTAERLEETSSRLTHVLEGSNDGFWDWHIPTGHVEYSRRFGEILGYGVAELAPTISVWQALIHPDDVELVTRPGTANLLGQTAHYESEHRLRHKDGHWIWALVRGKVVERDPSGSPVRATGTLSDITVRRRVQEQLESALREKDSVLDVLRASEVRFRNLFESHSAVMLLVDPKDGAIVDGNRAAEQFYGYDRAALRAMSLRDINTLPEQERTRNLERAARAELKSFWVPHRLASGEIRTVEVRSTPVEIEGRKLLFSIVLDVGEREQIQAALALERQRYLSIMKIAQDGIHLLDETGMLVDANESFLRKIGRGPEVIGKLHVRDWDATVPVDQMEATVRALILRPGLFETRHRRLDGSLIDVEVHAGGVELEGRKYLLAASRDITARKELEQKLVQKQEQLEDLNASLEERVAQAVAELRAKDQLLITQSRQAAMGEMIGNIAHQWRQPLNALGLVLSNLRDASRFGDLDAAEVERTVAEGNRLVQKMSSTINDFRDFFRPEKEPHPFSALAQIRETVALLDASLLAAGIEIEIDAPSDVEIVGYSNEYSQVLLNLLANAKQAITASHVPAGHITIRLEERGGVGQLSVRDNGGGIPEAIFDKIFEPYFSTKESGSGIGLYMSRQIVERSFGGRVIAQNVDGGAELTVVTPLARPPRP